MHLMDLEIDAPYLFPLPLIGCCLQLGLTRVVVRWLLVRKREPPFPATAWCGRRRQQGISTTVSSATGRRTGESNSSKASTVYILLHGFGLITYAA